ncbi:MAG: winged helix-turn-helix domain-containing protein [Idiomarina sp.]|nr:winged helix-turn-helix domain-containing protein [Idiomarina sp.]
MSPSFRFGPWVFHSHDGQLQHTNGWEHTLEPRLARLLMLFCENPDRLLTKDQIVDAVWAPRIVTDDSLVVAVSQLRKILREQDDDNYIKTRSGRGYVWLPETIEIPSNQSSTRNNKLIASLVAITLVVVFILMMALPQQSNTSISSEQTDPDTAIQHFRDVLDIGPDADAYLGLAHAKLARIDENEIPRHAEELLALLERALELNPNLVDAQRLKGMLQFYGHWDFAAAYQTLVEVYDSGKRTPRFLIQYSEVMLALGEFDRVVEAIGSLRTLHPEYFSTPTIAWLYLIVGDNASAQREIDRILRSDPPNFGSHLSAQHIAYAQHDFKVAFKHLSALMALDGMPQSTLREFQRIFENEGMVGVHTALLANPRSPRLGHYAPPLSLARHAIGADRLDLAVEHLQQAFDQRQFSVLWILVDPFYEPLYQHPGFLRLKEEFQETTGWPQEQARPLLENI